MECIGQKDLRDADGSIKDVTYRNVKNVSGSAPRLMFNLIQPLILSIEIGKSWICRTPDAENQWLPLELVPDIPVSLRALYADRTSIITYPGLVRALQLVITPQTQLSIERGGEKVHVTLTIAKDFRRTFIVDLFSIPELQAADT